MCHDLCLPHQYGFLKTTPPNLRAIALIAASASPFDAKLCVFVHDRFFAKGAHATDGDGAHERR